MGLLGNPLSRGGLVICRLSSRMVDPDAVETAFHAHALDLSGGGLRHGTLLWLRRIVRNVGHSAKAGSRAGEDLFDLFGSRHSEAATQDDV